MAPGSRPTPSPAPGGKAPDRDAFPPGIRLYIAALGGLTATGCLVWMGQGYQDRGTPWWTAPLLLVFLAAASSLLINFRYRRQVMSLDLFESVLAPAIVLLSGPVVVVLTVIAQMISERIHRVPLTKAAFNVTQWALAAIAGSLVFHAAAGPAASPARTLLALVLAMAAVVVVNTLAFGGALGMVHGRPLPEILAVHVPMILTGWVLNTAFGVLFVAAADRLDGAVALIAVPLVTLWSAYRANAALAADRRRMEGLYRASRILAAPIDPQDAIPAFLRSVRHSFQAGAVELVLIEAAGRLVHRVSGDDGDGYARRIETADADTLARALLARHVAVRVTARDRNEPLAGMLAREGVRDCLAAPLVSDGATLGAICVWNVTGLEGFEEGELAVLQAIAGEAAAMIAKSRLLGEILEERRKLSDIVTRASDGILAASSDGTIMTWNPGLEAITGFPAHEMVGTRLLARLQAHDAEGATVMLERWIDPRAPLPPHLRIVTREGEDRWLSCSYTRALDANQQPQMLIVVARDVTKLREIEQLKDDFVATVSHELRTPLTPIKGWATMLVERAELLGADERRIAAESIHRQAEHLELLITNLLEASQIERGDGTRRDEVVDTATIAARIVEEFQATQPGRAFRLQVESVRPALGDDLWIERILSNLLSNAVKYAPGADPIDVLVRSGDEWVEIRVVDRGPGIASRDVERIFDRFQRLGEPTTRSEGGAGLGLYIARRLAQSIGGSLAVESELGSGSTFILRLRAAPRLSAVG